MKAMYDNSSVNFVAPRILLSKAKRKEKQNHRGMVF